MPRFCNQLAQSLGRCAKRALLASAIFVACAIAELRASDILVVDRMSNGVYRYNQSGQLLGTVVQEVPPEGEQPQYLNYPTGLAISPDYTKLFVSSSQHSHVVQYDYNRTSGLASNPTIFADASDGLSFPNDIQFSPDGSTIYVANLGGGVSRFHTDGSSAGTTLVLPGNAATSSMVFASPEVLLAGAFQDSSGANGAVAVSNSSISAFPGFLVAPDAEITGATGLMIHNGYLYVSGLMKTNIRRFDLSTGQKDATWGISGVWFPQDLMEAPDGNGFLAGILGFGGGDGNISRYGYDGTFLSYFAQANQGGFTEATAFVVIPTQLIGDFNNNGVVDAADYVVWRKASPSATLPNDDTPGVVDTSDYADWRANFGKSALASGTGLGAGSVPEPTGGLLLLTAILAGSLLRRRP